MRHRILVIALLTGALHAQIPDFKPPTPLFGAVLSNNAPAVQKLLAEGANPNEGRFFGSPALAYAILHGNPGLIRALIGGGADVKALDRNGSTPLMLAVSVETPNESLIDDLLKQGVDPNVVNKQGETALTMAMRRGDAKLIGRLKAGGASDTEIVRQSVEKALALLQKSGAQFVRVSGCTSCHHQSVPQMAFAAARERGYQVDEANARQQLQAVTAMFRAIREPMEKGAMALPNPGISVSYSLLGMAAEGYAADGLTDAMIQTIVRTQQPDGRFAVLPGRPPIEASHFTSAALSIRALQIYGRGQYGERIAKARGWLSESKPVSNEDRTMRVLGLVWAKADSKDIKAASAELLTKQRPGGGWAQLDDVEADAYATGQALVALYEARVLTPENKAFQQGIAYLLRTQLADGSWNVRTRSAPVQQIKDSGFPHGRDQWISAAATSWAAMALSISQPKTGEHSGAL